MACFVSIQDPNKTQHGLPVTTDFQMHIGDPEAQEYLRKNIRNVVGIQADGDELIMILGQIDGIPLAYHFAPPAFRNGKPNRQMNRSIRWFGDTAKFIAANTIFCA